MMALCLNGVEPLARERAMGRLSAHLLGRHGLPDAFDIYGIQPVNRLPIRWASAVRLIPRAQIGVLKLSPYNLETSGPRIKNQPKRVIQLKLSI